METINFSKSITCIEVEKLFGKYNYKLQKEENQYSNDSLMILYGDNGSGKTIILKLLYHTLSTAPTRGHRTFIARIPFHKFSVEFEDTTRIIITRNDNMLIGGFNITLLKGKDIIAQTQYSFNHNKVSGEDAHFLTKLSDLDINIFILGDDRRLDSDVFSLKEDDREEIQVEAILHYISNIGRKSRTHIQSNSGINLESALESSIHRVEEWIKEQEYQGSDIGEKNVHNIYEEIVQNVIMSEQKNLELSEYHDFKKLIDDFEKQEKRSQKYSRFGLISPLNTQKFVELLNQSPPENYAVLRNILTPYLESIIARMDALQTTQEILTTFVNTINNGFLHDKKIKFHVRDGLDILTEEDGKNIALDPEMLSSGEKQLLLLFCNTIAAREKPTVFIIDEPEISLNIKWQRQLIQSLLKCTEGSKIQFLLATHSIELLSQYNNDVVDLENLEEATEREEEKNRETAIAS